jgi:hypothetical protein
MSCEVEASLISMMVDIVNVIFQSKNLNRIIAWLEMSSSFRYLHQEDKNNFFTNVIWAIGRRDYES